MNEGRKLEVLYAEDSEMASGTFLHWLEQDKREHNITHVVNGRLALEEAKKKQFDILITDVEMPEMSGYSLIDALAASGIKIPLMIVISNLIRGLDYNKGEGFYYLSKSGTAKPGGQQAAKEPCPQILSYVLGGMDLPECINRLREYLLKAQAVAPKAAGNIER